jgi:hypothetical protein
LVLISVLAVGLAVPAWLLWLARSGSADVRAGLPAALGIERVLSSQTETGLLEGWSSALIALDGAYARMLAAEGLARFEGMDMTLSGDALSVWQAGPIPLTPDGVGQPMSADGGTIDLIPGLGCDNSSAPGGQERAALDALDRGRRSTPRSTVARGW